MIKATAAHLASSSMSPRNLICKEEHVAAVKVGTILAEKNTSRPHLKDSIEWSQCTNGAKRTKAGDFVVYS